MKKIYIFMLISEFAFFLFSCNSVMPKIDFPYDHTVTVDDIISFNVTTTEIVFAEPKLGELFSFPRGVLGSRVGVCFDDQLVFWPPLSIFPLFSSVCPDDLTFRISNDNTIYLADFYQGWGWLSGADREKKKKQEDENRTLREKQMEGFINYLREAGKIIEGSF